MAVGFGFSVGDFLNALELVSTVIDAVQDSGSASSEYRELLNQLQSLRTALSQVERLDIDQVQHSELIALKQAASRCEGTIEGFWHKIRKYQPHLTKNISSHSGLKDKWMRIKWAFCTKDDVAKFKADLLGHTESINILLASIQIHATQIQNTTQHQRQRSLTGMIQHSYLKSMQKWSCVSGHIMTGLQQSKQLLETSAKILKTNIRIFQVVLAIHDKLMKIPGQVERQQPVYLIDAFGRSSPFHLEFIRSPEALLAVLAVDFEKFGAGAMIRDREFVLEDSLSKQDIDLDSDWDLCFFPGQQVEMSMILQHSSTTDALCPRCENPCDGDGRKETEWSVSPQD